MAYLNYEGLKRYDKKTKEYIKDKIDEVILNVGETDLSKYATKTELKNHTDDTNLHVTSDEKNTWNNKLDNSDLTNYATKTYVTNAINQATSGGTVDLTPYAKKADVNSALDTKVDKVDGKSLISDREIARLKLVDNYDDTDIKNALNKKANKSELFSGSYNDLTDKPTIPDVSNLTSKTEFKNHTDDTGIHITSAERTKWNNKAEASDIPSLTNYATKTYVTDEIAKASTGGKVDLTGYAKTADVNASLDTKVDKVSGKSLISDTEIARLKLVDNYDDTDIKNNLKKKANVSDLTAHTDDTSIHITSAERNKWNAKAEVSDIPSLTGYATKTYVTEEIAKVSTSGQVDLSSYAKKVDVNSALDDKVDKVAGKSLISNSEITRLAQVDNYDDTDIKSSITNINTELAKKANKSDINTKVDKVTGKGLSTNDYTTDDKTKVGKIVTNGNGTTFLANDGTYKKVGGSSASAVAERKFKPAFGFDTYWGEMRDNHGNKNQVELSRIKEQIDQCEAMKVDRIICTIHLGWDETTNSLVIAENTDSISTAISYCNGKNVTTDTAKVHVHFKGTTASEKDYINNTIGMSTFQTKYKAMLNTICNFFKGTTVTRIIILNEMWYITNANLRYSSFVNECLNIVKNAGYTTGLSMAGFNSNLQLSDEVIQNLDTFYINVYPGISGFGKYMTKQEAIEAFEQCDVDLWIEKIKKQYPNKKIVISEMGVDDYWENLAAPSTWYVNGTSKTGGYAVDTYITAMLEFFINKHVDIEELWWWYDLYYEPVKETLLNYLGGDR